MEKGLEKATITGVPQGGPLSVVCSNIYLDKLDKELEQRGLRFTRYADDVLIFTKSEMAANRVMKSICSWLERKLFLKVNATKTKVVRPTRSKYLGFTFLKNGSEWKVRPTNEKKKKLKKKLSEYLKRGKAVARPLAVTIKRVNEIVRPLREFCVSDFRQNQEYHVFNVQDEGLFPLSTPVPEGWDGMRAVCGVNAGPARRESCFKGISPPSGRRT